MIKQKVMATDRRRPEENFQRLVEHSLAGIAMFQDDRFLYVNPKYCEIFGYSRSELLAGMSPLDLVDEVERPLTAAMMTRRLRGEEAEVEYLFKGRRKDGILIDVEIHGAVMQIDERPALIATLLDVSAHFRV